MKFSKKHIAIFETIIADGYYKPTYSDREPATQTLIRNGFVDWRGDFRGVVFTKLGEIEIRPNIDNLKKQLQTNNL